jgi:hypothetical protein
VATGASDVLKKQHAEEMIGSAMEQSSFGLALPTS